MKKSEHRIWPKQSSGHERSLVEEWREKEESPAICKGRGGMRRRGWKDERMEWKEVHRYNFGVGGVCKARRPTRSVGRCVRKNKQIEEKVARQTNALIKSRDILKRISSENEKKYSHTAYGDGITCRPDAGYREVLHGRLCVIW